MTTPLRRAQLMRYAPWVARDYLSNQGPSTALVVLLIAFLSLQSANSAGLALREMSAEVQQRILRQLVASLAFLGTFFATNGIVANDRKQGYYKFLFSKPVAPPLYYAMIFAVYGAGLLVVTAALLGLWAVTVHPVLPSMLFPVVTLMYVAYGGIGFLLSAAWRFDWISLVTVLLAANVGWGLWGDTTGVPYALLHLLPPVHHAERVYDLILHGTSSPFPWLSVAWLGGYGFACFLLGMLVIRKRPLGQS
jgi:nitrate reductase NapE component